MITFFQHFVVSNYNDFCWIDDDYDQELSSKNHEKRNTKLKFVKISVKDCDVFDFQLLQKA
jgi:hypothetical protein